MDDFEKFGDPSSSRYDDRGESNAEDPYDTSKLEQQARVALLSGLNKYHTLREMVALQKEMAALIAEQPLLRSEIESRIDARALQIIENRLRTFTDENHLRSFLVVAKEYPFYNLENKKRAQMRMLEVGDGILRLRRDI